MARSITLAFAPNLDLTRDALASSTLNHGLMVLGESWIISVLMGAFTGVTRFEEWQTQLGIPRPTLANRLKTLVELGLMRKRPYQERPRRMAYHLTKAGLKLYSHVLMVWVWERRWGTRRAHLPDKLLHTRCGHAFVPTLICAACGEKAGVNDLQLTLKVNKSLLAKAALAGRTARLGSANATRLGLGLRVDRWSLMIVAAVVLGCQHFDALVHVLGIASSVLARRLSSMVEAGLLLNQPDLRDARRSVYRLTPASRDLFGYLVCSATWAAGEYLHQPSSIRPIHKDCGKPFVPLTACSACGDALNPWDVSFQGLHSHSH